MANSSVAIRSFYFYGVYRAKIFENRNFQRCHVGHAISYLLDFVIFSAFSERTI